MNTAGLSRSHVVSRVAASLLGSYAFVWGLSSLVIALGVVLGAGYHEAQTLVYLLAFLVFLATFCWAFVEASLSRVWGVLAGGGVLMTGAAWLLARSVL